MLMAILYAESGEIVAAAPACDQYPLGKDYWRDCFLGELDLESTLDVGYINVVSEQLRSSLLRLGVDDSVNPNEIEAELQRQTAPTWSRAA